MTAPRPRRSSLPPAAVAFSSPATAPNAAPSRDDVIYRPDGSAIKPKPVRITVDLDHDRYSALITWLGAAFSAVDPAEPRRVGIAQAMRAMLDATVQDEVVTAVVLDQLRRVRG